jgi:NAD(P)-dependent dehydrogenase (short-subunit alcohol dehydrogenase family)
MELSHIPAADTNSDKSRKPAMETPKYTKALIVGAGEGLSASLARLLAREGIKVALAARQIEKLGALCTETGAHAFACNATEPVWVGRARDRRARCGRL